MTQSFAKTSCALFVACALICAAAYALNDNLRASYWAVMSAAWCVLWLLAALRAALARTNPDPLPPPDPQGGEISSLPTTGASQGGGRFPEK